jgi:hypothetical protein
MSSYLELERLLVKALDKALQTWAQSEEELEDACVSWVEKFSPEILAPTLYRNRETIKSRALKGRQLKALNPCLRYRIKWGEQHCKIEDVEKVEVM